MINKKFDIRRTSWADDRVSSMVCWSYLEQPMIKTTFETLNWTIYTLSTAQMYEATLQRNYTNSSFAKKTQLVAMNAKKSI